MVIIRTLLIFFFVSMSAIVFAGEGKFSNQIVETKHSSLTEKYDVFTEGNREYIIRLKEDGSTWGGSFSLSAKEKSTSFTISSTMGRGDGRYSKPRSGSFLFKFDNDDKVYNFSGTSYYLRTVYAYRDKKRDKEFLEKLAQKNHVYVKVIVVGVEHVFKVSLKGTNNILQTGKFLI